MLLVSVGLLFTIINKTDTLAQNLLPMTINPYSSFPNLITANVVALVKKKNLVIWIGWLNVFGKNGLWDLKGICKKL